MRELVQLLLGLAGPQAFEWRHCYNSLLLIPGIRWSRQALEHSAVRGDGELDAYLVEFLGRAGRKNVHVSRVIPS
jgi:hypothetical protein